MANLAKQLSCLDRKDLPINICIGLKYSIGLMGTG